MVCITVKVGPKGQIVIPKSLREAVGILKDKTIQLEVKDKSIEIHPNRGQEILEKWRKQAKYDVSTWKMGDELYGEVFQ